MAKLIWGIIITMLLTGNAQAEPQLLPKAVVGNWCLIKYPGDTYRRQSKNQQGCPATEGDALQMRRDGFTDNGTTCKIIEWPPRWTWPIKFRCSEPGSKAWIARYLVSMFNGNLVLTTDVNEWRTE